VALYEKYFSILFEAGSKKYLDDHQNLSLIANVHALLKHFVPQVNETLAVRCVQLALMYPLGLLQASNSRDGSSSKEIHRT
jgi:hypothetical protein